MTQIRNLGILIVFIMSCLPGLGQVHLEEAIEQGIIQLEAKGTGGYQGKCLTVSLQNLSESAVRVIIPAGSYFSSIDGDIQDLVVTSNHTAVIAAGQPAQISLWTMCTQSFNSSPYRGADYAFSGMAADGLTRLAETIAKNHYQNSTAQSAVWAMSSREPVETVYGIDTVQTRSLAEVLSEELEIPMDRFVMESRPHVITSIDASLECFLESDLRPAKLVMVREDGTVFREFFDDRSLEKGFHQFKIGASHTLDSSETFTLQLLAGNQLIQSKEICRLDTILVLDSVNQEVRLPVKLNAPGQVEVALIDQEGRYVMQIQPLKTWPAGYYSSRVRVGTPVMPDATYFVAAISDGEVLGQVPIETGTSMPVLHSPLEVRGVWQLSLTENPGKGRMALYNQQGQLVRVFAEFSSLRPGDREFSYQFQHRDGPGAVFTLRLETPDGILHSLEIQSE